MNEQTPQIVGFTVRDTRTGQRVTIGLDPGEPLEVDPELVVQYQLRSGQSLDPETIDALRREDECLRARRRLVGYLSLRVKSIADARQYLERGRFSESAIETTVAYAVERDLLNDERFAERFVRTRLKTGIYGPLRLLADLMGHGIDTSLAERVLAPQFDLDWQREAAGALAQRRIERSTGPAKGDPVKKLFDWLQRRGFQPEVAREVAERAREEI